MGKLTTDVAGKLVAVDSAPLIYYLEEHPGYLLLADELFEGLDRGDMRGVTSVLTLLEVLVKPLREGRRDLADTYRRYLTNAIGLTVCSIDESICERAAQLRARHSWLRVPDAVQVATALQCGADLIVTNDDRWKHLTEIPVIVLRDYVDVKA